MLCVLLNQWDFFAFFLSRFFFHEHPGMTGQQGKGEGISVTPQPLHRHLDIIQAITGD